MLGPVAISGFPEKVVVGCSLLTVNALVGLGSWIHILFFEFGVLLLSVLPHNQGDQCAPAAQVPDAKTATRFWRRCRRRYTP